ncbi:MAG: hypothetical protein WCL00_14810, partial [Bacteroidota bacterium]
VGPDHYVQVVNSNFAVYSKTGTTLLGPAALSTIWAGIPAPWNGTNNGDPVVLYDQAANRWLISQFSLPAGNYAELVAVSQTADPTGAWYRYVFQFGTKMPDYPKFGIWPDGYYMSINQFLNGSSWAGAGACALERSKMLAGDPTARIVYFDFGVSGNPQSMLPSDWDGTVSPPENEPNYFCYFDDYSSLTEQYLRIWKFHTDWSNTSNSTITLLNSLVTAPFNEQLCVEASGRGRCIPQPETAIKLESLSDRLMFRLQYRNFSDHVSMVTNHTINVNGSGVAGLRWYELRKSGNNWSIYQQGTYSPDVTHRWVGSVAMNAIGDIALGYSVSKSTSIYPSIRYTGRKSSDPLGVMTLPEQTIINGNGSQTGPAARWGDYSGMSVDPSNDDSFWFTTEYIQTAGGAPWKTRIASFRFLSVDATAAPTSLCIGQQTQLNAVVTGGSTPYSYSWTSNPAGFTSLIQNPQVQPGATTRYIVQVSDGVTTLKDSILVTVNPLPTPSISGNTDPCLGQTNVIYSTESGMQNYSWNISAGGIITAGANTNEILVAWNGTGNQTISINYSTLEGCSALTPCVKSILVHPASATWNGNVSSDWSSGANWNGGVAPGPCSNITIPA